MLLHWKLLAVLVIATAAFGLFKMVNTQSTSTNENGVSGPPTASISGGLFPRFSCGPVPSSQPWTALRADMLRDSRVKTRYFLVITIPANKAVTVEIATKEQFHGVAKLHVGLRSVDNAPTIIDGDKTVLFESRTGDIGKIELLLGVEHLKDTVFPDFADFREFAMVKIDGVEAEWVTPKE